jgi:hypothetical protein
MGAAAAAAVAALALLAPPRAPAPAPQAAPPPAREVATAPAPAAAPSPAPALPRFELVRVEPDGAATVAGAVPQGGAVRVLIDGAVATEAPVSDGAFVAFVQIPAGEGVRRLDLEATGDDGAALRSADPVFVTAPKAHAPDAAPPPAPGVARAGADGVELMQPPAAAAGEVTLDAVSYDERGALVLAGRADPAREVAIYADGELVGRTLTERTGRWRAQAMTALAPGAYTLRLDEIGPGGAVESRIETPFERAAPDALRLASGEIVVQPGDTLWRIAEQVYGGGVRYTVIYDANETRIRDPDLIYPGQVFIVPEAGAQP